MSDKAVRVQMTPEAITSEIEKFNFENDKHKAIIYRIIAIVGINVDVIPKNVFDCNQSFMIEYPYNITLAYYTNNIFKYRLWKRLNAVCSFNIDDLQGAETVGNYISMVLEMLNDKHIRQV